MKFNRLLCAAVLLAPSVAGANELLRVYDLAAQNDTQLQAARYEHDANVLARPLALGPLLPQVTGVANASKQHDDIFTYETVCTGTSCPPSATTTVGLHGTKSGDPFSATLRLTQTVFDWAAFERYSQADDTVAAAEAAYLKEQQNLALRVSQAYFALLAAADQVRTSQAALDAFERQLEQAKKRFEVGLSAITDVQDAQARYDAAVAQKIADDQALGNASRAVSQLTGSPDVRIAPLQDDIPLVGPDPADINQWLKAADDGNLDLAVSRFTAHSAEKDIGIQRAGHYPTVALSASEARVKQAGFNEFYDNSAQVGVQLTLPIFAGFQVYNATSRAQRTYEQRQAELEGVRRTVAVNTRNNYGAVVANIERVKAGKQAVLSNTTAVEASQVGLEVGTRTQVDVLNAQQQLTSAQRTYYQSRYDYLQSVLALKFVAGRLSQQDVAQMDKLLTEAGPAVAH